MCWSQGQREDSEREGEKNGGQKGEDRETDGRMDGEKNGREGGTDEEREREEGEGSLQRGHLTGSRRNVDEDKTTSSES